MLIGEEVVMGEASGETAGDGGCWRGGTGGKEPRQAWEVLAVVEKMLRVCLVEWANSCNF